MDRLHRIALSLGLASAVLTGCSKAAPPAPGPEPGPSSSLLSVVTFPAGSKLEKTEQTSGAGAIESWIVPLSFAEETARLRKQLPIDRSFAGAPYKGEEAGIDKAGNEVNRWTWTDAPRTQNIVDVGAVAITSETTKVVVGINEG